MTATAELAPATARKRAIGPAVRKAPTDEVQKLENDIKLYRSHIRDLRSEITLAEKGRAEIALALVEDDESSRQDSQRYDDVEEHLSSLNAEIRQYTAAIRGVESKIDLLTTKHCEHLIREELKRRQAWIRQRVAGRREELRVDLGLDKKSEEHLPPGVRPTHPGLDSKVRADKQDELDNLETLCAREHDNHLAPQRYMPQEADGRDHSYSDIKERGDIILGGVRIPGSEYNQIRARIERELGQ